MTNFRYWSKDALGIFAGVSFALLFLPGGYVGWLQMLRTAEIKLRPTVGDDILTGACLFLAAFSAARLLLIPRHSWFVGANELIVNTLFVILLWFLVTLGWSWKRLSPGRV